MDTLVGSVRGKFRGDSPQHNNGYTTRGSCQKVQGSSMGDIRGVYKSCSERQTRIHC